MLAISSLSVGSRNVVLLLLLERQSEKCLCEQFILSQFQPQKQSNLKVFAISQGSYLQYHYLGRVWQVHRCYSFQRNKGFNSGSCVGNNTIFKPTCQSYSKYKKHLKLEINYFEIVWPLYQNTTNTKILLSDNFENITLNYNV